MADLPTTDPAEIVELHRRLFDRLSALPDVAAALEGQGGVIRIRLSEPDVTLRLDLAGAESLLSEVPAGEEAKADVTISMKWETAHRFWSGDLDLMGSLLSGAIMVEGTNMDPLFRLKAIVHQAREAYREVVEELRGD